jgi:transcriptional regulator PpsR
MDASSHASSSGTPFSDASTHLSGLDAQSVALLIEQAADVALILEDGIIRDVAIASEDLKRTGFAANWIGRRWVDTVSADSHPKIEAMLKGIGAKAGTRARQVNHPLGGMHVVPVAYRLVRANARGPVVAIGRDLRDVAELQQKLVKAQQAIERDYARLRKAEARYKMIFETVAEPIVIVTADDLTAETGNRAAAALLGHETHGVSNIDFVSLFAPRAARTIERFAAKALASGNAAADRVELATGKKISLSASVFGQGNDARLVVRFAGDTGQPKPSETTREQLLRTLEALPDAFVVTDDELRILTANPAFLEMAHLSEEEQATGARLSQYLGRSTTDLNVLISTLKNNGNARNFATVLRDRFNTEEQVEVSAVATNNTRPVMYAFSVRIVSRRLPSDPPPGEELPRSVDHLTNLVGRMPLKDIVRDSTTLIERLCIEAALKLTDDNRASAAEILGLSRQGLYSKLKRFGIEDKN